MAPASLLDWLDRSPCCGCAEVGLLMGGPGCDDPMEEEVRRPRKPAMKTIYHVYAEGNEIGEADVFFDVSGNLLALWSHNDALYLDEYMSPLFEALGIKVERPKGRQWPKRAEMAVKAEWGLDDSSDDGD